MSLKINFQINYNLLSIEQSHIMKYFIVISIIFQITTVELLLFDRKGLQWKGPDVTRKSTRLISEQWIEQKLDNFDPQNNQTFQMVCEVDAN